MDGASEPHASGGADVDHPAEPALLRSVTRGILMAAAVVLLLWFLYQTRQAVLLFVLALILMMTLNAPVLWLQRSGLGRGLATAIVFVALFAFTGAGLWVVLPRLAEEIPTLVEELPAVVDDLSGRLGDLMGGSPEVDRQVSQIVAWLERGVGEAWRVLDTAAATLLFLLFVVAMVLYMVSDPQPLLRWYVQSMPPHLREPAVRAFHRSARMVVGWVLANAIMGGIKGVAAFLFLTFMDVPGALIWSLLALFAALIPRVGFYLMSIPPVVVALTVSPATALYTLLFFWALSEFLGNFVAPRVQGEIMELHAAYLLFMALAMGLAFGLLGVIVSAPFAGFLKVFYDEFYLRRQPPDPELEDHVEQMLTGSIEGARALGKDDG